MGMLKTLQRLACRSRSQTRPSSYRVQVILCGSLFIYRTSVCKAWLTLPCVDFEAIPPWLDPFCCTELQCARWTDVALRRFWSHSSVARSLLLYRTSVCKVD